MIAVVGTFVHTTPGEEMYSQQHMF